MKIGDWDWFGVPVGIAIDVPIGIAVVIVNDAAIWSGVLGVYDKDRINLTILVAEN